MTTTQPQMPAITPITNDNLILMSDSYKFSHRDQYPYNMISMFDYIESRGSTKGVVIGYTRFFGLQMFLQRYFNTLVTEAMVHEARDVLSAHGVPFDFDGWMYIAKDLKGKLPLRIRAIPEGTIVPNHNVLVTVESTCPHTPWVVGWAETALLKAVWYPTTVCTRSYKIKTLIKRFLDMSCDAPDAELPFKLHDFGYRGASSEETAGIGGVAHLVNFSGTDTIKALQYARNYYGATMPGFSVPASEHSTTTSHGPEGELDFIRKLLKMYGGKFPIISAVSDSYNFFKLVDSLAEIKNEILSSGSVFVVRPDSGNPVGNVAYAVDHLDKIFGSYYNAKGYKVLLGVRVLQGDGINEDVIYDILNSLVGMGYSAENVVFGMGGALLQGNDEQSLNRDTFKFAMKCSSITLAHTDRPMSEFLEERDVFKSPITDMGKVSKKGRLDLIFKGLDESHMPIFETVRLEKGQLVHPNSALRTVYENGQLLVWEDLDTIRQRN